MTSTTPIGAIATPHSSATEVGSAVLRAGGNAIDAAIAAALALCVTYPNNVALGSDLVALVTTPDGGVIEINATGGAPIHATLEQMRQRHGDALPMYGVDTINVPGAVRGLQALLELGGTKSWAELVEPAARLAREGVPLPSSVAKGIRALESEMLADPGCREAFFDDGRPLDEGELFQQEALARTLTQIAENGPDEFYTGEVGRAWLSTLQSMGSLLTEQDLADYRPVTGEALTLNVGHYRISSSGPNTQGFALPRAVRQAGNLNADGEQRIDRFELALAFHDINAVRDQYLGDPKFGCMSGQELLDVAVPERVDAQYRGRPMGDTIGIAVSSADGYAVSLIQSVYFQFGSAVLDPSTGILFQNRGTSFSLDPRTANCFAPAKRPSHTLMPVLIHDADRLRWVSATMGGQGQPQIHAQLLAVALEGSDPLAAVQAPRWLVGRQTPSDMPHTVTAEAGVDDALLERLAEAGMHIKRIDALSDVVGHANLIELHESGEVFAASDPRSDGSAEVVFA